MCSGSGHNADQRHGDHPCLVHDSSTISAEIWTKNKKVLLNINPHRRDQKKHFSSGWRGKEENYRGASCRREISGDGDCWSEKEEGLGEEKLQRGDVGVWVGKTANFDFFKEMDQTVALYSSFDFFLYYDIFVCFITKSLKFRFFRLTSCQWKSKDSSPKVKLELIMKRGVV